jgi:endonuclease YncB( thermonuclease family)
MSVFADQGMVKSVIDGNTLMIEIDGEETKILISGIDSPERGQEFGEDAKNYLHGILHGRNVEFVITGKDRKGNQLAEIYLKSLNIKEELVTRGLAWVAEKNDDAVLLDIQAKAKEKQKGLWKESNPTPPWIFRREQSMLQPKSS